MESILDLEGFDEKPPVVFDDLPCKVVHDYGSGFASGGQFSRQIDEEFLEHLDTDARNQFAAPAFSDQRRGHDVFSPAARSSA